MQGTEVTIVLLCALVIFLAHAMLTETSLKMALVRSDDGNEALIMECKMANGQKHLFQVDTAYAGAPVLSLAYLTYLRARGATDWMYSKVLGPERCYADIIRSMQKAPLASERDMHEAASRFIAQGRCRSFTAGCTVRLMGIGSTTESHSSMLLCPPLDFSRNPRLTMPPRWDSDILVTHPLQGGVHILTVDYLIHHSPAILEISTQSMRLSVSPTLRARFDTQAAHLVGSAFVIRVTVGGAEMDVLVDTGASAPLSLGSSAARKIKVCHRSGERRATQRGVHGEEVCSDIISTEVRLGRWTLPSVDVLVNSTEVGDVDGYLGLGVLRAFDIYISHGEIGFRRNANLPLPITSSSAGSCVAARQAVTYPA